jgi:tungstate transport system substrate-binding protein
MSRRIGWLICLGLAGCTSAAPAPALRLGTTTTVQASGALEVLDSLWRGRPIAPVIGPSGQILRAAASGDLDVVVTHAPALEERLLVQPRLVALRCGFVASRFAIVGPANDPAGVTRAPDAAAALGRIAARRARFISRGDSSGTHIKELALWRAAGVAPGHQPWYVESGADQATTLHLADERDAYALADLPSLARIQGLRLRVLLSADSSLRNPYTLYVVRSLPPSPHSAPPAAARAFAEWAMGPWRAALLAHRLPDGTPAFEPRDEACTTPS